MVRIRLGYGLNTPSIRRTFTDFQRAFSGVGLNAANSAAALSYNKGTTFVKYFNHRWTQINTDEWNNLFSRKDHREHKEGVLFKTQRREVAKAQRDEAYHRG